MTRAESRAGGVLLRGAKTCVLDAPVAGMLLVSACELDGYSLFSVPVDAPGVVLKPWTTVVVRLTRSVVSILAIWVVVRPTACNAVRAAACWVPSASICEVVSLDNWSELKTLS